VFEILKNYSCGLILGFLAYHSKIEPNNLIFYTRSKVKLWKVYAKKIEKSKTKENKHLFKSYKRFFNPCLVNKTFS